MTPDNKQEWMRLCEVAAKEQDPEKLMELVREITRLLEQREAALKVRNGGTEQGSVRD
jgi:hypothetical protein